MAPVRRALPRPSPPSRLWDLAASATVRGTILLVAVVAAAVAAGLGFALLTYEVQMGLVVFVVIVLAAMWFIPRAVAKEPTVTPTMLAVALGAKVVGSLGRYGMYGFLYDKGDAFGFHQFGVAQFEMVRTFDFSFIDKPYFGTAFMQDFTGFLYAIIGPSFLGAFLVCGALSFLGMWAFYRAHRVAFPNGDARLFFVFLFFVPTMFFWPSSLGKDSIVVFGLGIGTYGVARLLQGFSARAALQLLLGLVVLFLVRPPVAVMLLAAGGFAFLIHPGRMSQPLARPTSWILLAPVLAAGLFFAGRWAASFENLESVDAAAEEYGAAQQRLESGGSEFEAAIPTSPAAAAGAVVTVLFRPFPWEVDLGPAVLAGMEGLALFLIVLWRFGPALRALRQWRGGMIVVAVLMTLFLIIPLTAFSNFGLLARQRAQLLPYVLIVLTAVKRRPYAVPVTAPAPVPA